MLIREYHTTDLEQMINIWNEVVEEGILMMKTAI